MNNYENPIVYTGDNNIGTVPSSHVIQSTSIPNSQCTSQKISLDDVKSSIHNASISFLAKLYAIPNISRSATQDIVNNTSELFGSCGIDLIREVIKNKKINDSELVSMLNIVANPFGNLQTEYLRKQYFSDIGSFIEP